MAGSRVTQSLLQSVIHYEPETGQFTWRDRTDLLPSLRGKYSFRPAGNKNKVSGYIYIMFGGKNYPAHRLAWLYIYGEFPSLGIDHINRIRHDNRITNLRLATITQNAANSAISRRNSSGFKGVSLDRRCAKAGHKNIYEAYISINNKKVHLGRFPTPEEAHNEYLKAARIRHGEYHYAGRGMVQA